MSQPWRAPPWCARCRRRGRARSPAYCAIQVGVAALHLGAGRRTKDDTIDHAVGVVCLRKRGDAVEQGEVLAEVHARDEVSASEAVAAVAAAYEIGDRPVASGPVLLEIVG